MNFYEIDKKLKAEFASKRLAAESRAESNLAKVSAVSSYSKINALLKDLIVESSKIKNPTERKQVKKEIESLKKQKNFILKSLGLTENDLAPKYSCKKCNDSGFVGGKMCECFQKRRNEEIMKACGLSFENKHDFKTYSTQICTDKKQAEMLNKEHEYPTI